MKKILSFYFLMVFIISPSAQAIVIEEYSVFLYSSSVSTESLLNSSIGGPGDNDFLGTGIDVVFNNNLDADNFGFVSWDFTNNTGSVLEDTQLFVFLDAEIDQQINTFFNEFGALVDVSGAGAADNLADSWEIDEPGYIFGDIYDNLFLGALDNTNDVPVGLEDDVSLALGFELGNLLPGMTWTGIFETSLSNIGGLSHADPDSASTFFFNGTVDIAAVSVEEPAALLLIFVALLGLMDSRRYRK